MSKNRFEMRDPGDDFLNRIDRLRKKSGKKRPDYVRWLAEEQEKREEAEEALAQIIDQGLATSSGVLTEPEDSNSQSKPCSTGDKALVEQLEAQMEYTREQLSAKLQKLADERVILLEDDETVDSIMEYHDRVYDEPVTDDHKSVKDWLTYLWDMEKISFVPPHNDPADVTEIFTGVEID